jgi:predicted transcriptional regulator
MNIPLLTDNEYEVMVLFWRANRSLHYNDIFKCAEESGSWHPNSSRRLLNSLVKKEYIEPDGYVKGTYHIMQTYKVKLSQNDYLLTRFGEVVGDSQNKGDAALDLVSAFLSRYCDVSHDKIVQIREIVNEGT